VFVTELKGDPRLSDESGYGVVARENLFKGEHFYDPSVKWVRGEPPEDLRNKYPNFYAKCSGYKEGGFLQLAAPAGSPMAFKSTTFYVNEARPGNHLRGSREANTEYFLRHLPDGNRICTLKMLRDVEKNEELVVFYDSLHKPRRTLAADESNHNRRSDGSRQGDRVGRPMVVQGLARGKPTGTSDLIAPEIEVEGRVRWWADDDSEDDASLESKAKTPAQKQEKQSAAESENDNYKLISTASDKLSQGGKSLCASGRLTFTKEIIDLTMDSDEDGKIIQLRQQEGTAARE